ncbi:hypothetical protein DVU_1701 [Nitratidesulfovibrio vulgaris str. Hildenborough]|uniref:Uncharacterized protein n=1 Tax=Nitratidesulfovibrio vulgaris (strain ATCC 29579 / DSM 644 / CCUG 34227 / NCIMB 8303 / VKM B-1760 / Hildenborough) TaxID=882 RepID=Q72BD5_NITV2|nr:hypothetical protein DVU_1701 [Nitratidesulfovibrio vulgaris str. Hildenborough]
MHVAFAAVYILAEHGYMASIYCWFDNVFSERPGIICIRFQVADVCISLRKHIQIVFFPFFSMNILVMNCKFIMCCLWAILHYGTAIPINIEVVVSYADLEWASVV